jgi:hypothetical protein
MMKHSSLLKAQMFKDGTEPAISLNPVLSATASTNFNRSTRKKKK